MVCSYAFTLTCIHADCFFLFILYYFLSTQKRDIRKHSIGIFIFDPNKQHQQPLPISYLFTFRPIAKSNIQITPPSIHQSMTMHTSTSMICLMIVAVSMLFSTTQAADNPRHPPTCVNTDGTGAAFSPDLCIANGMLPRSDNLYMRNHACKTSTCKTSDCCVTEKKEENKFLDRSLLSERSKKRILHSDDKSVCFYPGQSNGGQSGSTGSDVSATDSFYIYIGSNHGSMGGECFDANENQGRVDVQMSTGGGSATTVWSRNPDPGTAPTINGALSNQVNLIDSTNLDGSWSTTVSPDGKHVYAVACYSNSIVWWQRDSTTGALTNQVNLRDDSNLV